MLYAIANVTMKTSRVIGYVSYYDLRVGVVIALDVVYVEFTLEHRCYVDWNNGCC